jgi:hypothetical protein
MASAHAERPAQGRRRDRLAGWSTVAVAHRYALLSTTALVLWLLAGHGGYADDWHFFVQGANSLTNSSDPTGGLHVYATHPYLQFGPLALLVVVPLRLIGPDGGWMLGSALCMGLGVLTLALVERAAILVGGVFFLKAWCYPAVDGGHPDDVLALTGIAVTVLAVARQRWILAAVAIGCAGAAKPWAFMALVLVAAIPGRRLRVVALAVAVGFAPWLPFVVADPHTLDLGQFHLSVAPGSSLTWLGLAAARSAPSWPRLLQFVVAGSLSAWALARGRWMLIPLIAFAVRINLDPLVTTYYPAGVVLGALIWDVTAPTRIPGLRTIVTWLLLLAVPLDLFLLDHALASPGLNAALRLTILLAPLAALAFGQRTSALLGIDAEGHPAGNSEPHQLALSATR